MIRGLDAAKYFISLDKEGSLFNKNLITMNGRRFYEGNARLNKYLHLAQNIYIAKTGKPLMDSVFFAYDNGAVVPEIQESYSALLNLKNKSDITIPNDEKEFLDKIFLVFKNATLDELIDMSHEDSEWLNKHNYYDKEHQKMDTLARAEEYKEQYADIVKVMDRMVI